MSTFKVLLDKRRTLRGETYPLVVRIYTGTKFKDISLKTHLQEKDFDARTQRVIGKHPNKKTINQKIENTLLQVQQTALKLEMAEEVVTSDKIKNLVVKPQAKLDFIQYGWLKVAELKENNHYGNSCFYRDGINALVSYSGKSSIAFREIDFNFLKHLESKMLAGEVKINTVALTMRTIRAIYNKAIKERQVDKTYYPFDEFKIKSEATAKRNIAKEDIAALLKLELKEDSQQFHARNYFMLSFNLRGISFADMVSIKPSDIINGRLVYKRRKTHKLYNIKLTDKAQQILNYYMKPGRTYILPVIPESAVDNAAEERKHIQYGTKTTNKYLKKMGEGLKIPMKLSTYVSRHSHATIAKKLGFSKDLISESLGHSYGNKITEIYLGSYDMETLDAMNETVCKF